MKLNNWLDQKTEMRNDLRLGIFIFLLVAWWPWIILQIIVWSIAFLLIMRALIYIPKGKDR